MTLRTIITNPAKVLKRKTRKVTDFGEAFQTLVDDMIDTMRDAPGVGLAATQIGVSQSVFVAEYGSEEDEKGQPKLYVMVNPEILRFSQELVKGVEGCLSVPGLVGEVERSIWIVIRAQNRHGHPIKIRAENWLARIFQHENDHLNGILFIDQTDEIWETPPDFDENVPTVIPVATNPHEEGTI